MSAAQALVEIDDLVVELGGRQVLCIDRLVLAAGEVVGILGPNGAGKSTLVRTIAQLITPSAGAVRWSAGPGAPGAVRWRCAAVLQRPLLVRGTALTNAAAGLRYRGVGRREACRRAGEWLERLGIGELADRDARELSGGEGQRVSLARALATEPELLVLDEALSSLDEHSRGALVTDLADVLAEVGAAALVVTHDRREVAALAARTIVLAEGQILGDGPSRTVLRDAELAAVTGGSGVLDAALARCLDGP